jgi:mRNA interferase MazF
MTTNVTPLRYKRGDVVLVLFPDSNLRSAKRRPVVIVQADNLQTGLPQLIVAMITSNLARLPHPSRVFVSRTNTSGQHAGLLTDSVVMTDNLVTIAETEIDRTIGFLPMPEIDRALRHTLGL